MTVSITMKITVTITIKNNNNNNMRIDLKCEPSGSTTVFNNGAGQN